MGNFNFYSVVGRNGVAVMDSWEGVQRIKKYIKGIQLRGFDCFEDAEHWALLMFSDYLPKEYDCPLELQVNRAVFKKNLRPEWL